MSLRPAPLLQSERSFSVSSDNGTTTPLPVPYNDFWDINTVPNAGLTQVYQITNISEYQGRVIYVNKTQNTAGATIRISLPGGYTFSSTGTQHYDFPDIPTQLIISISTSAVVAIQVGGSGVGPNSTLINYQVPDLSTGSGNVISLISDTNGNNYIDTTFGGELTIASAGDVNISTNQIMNFQASQGYAIPIAPTKTLSITGANGIVNAATANINLPNLANVSTANTVNYNTVNGRLTYAAKSNPTQINYQVPDLSLGSGNVITTIADSNGNNYVDCSGSVVAISSVGDIQIIADALHKIIMQGIFGIDMQIGVGKQINIGTTSAGTCNINPGACNIPGTSVTIGPNGAGTINLRSATLLASNIPSVTTANILYYDPATKAITYGLK